MIALGLASVGLFALAEVFMYYRERGVLKRMAAAPLNRNIFMLALVTSRFLGSLVSALLVLITGKFLFGVSYAINWFYFVPYVLIATVVMMGLGALITLVTKTSDSAAQVASILITVMVFFSGIYFPVEFLPSYFQKLSLILPLSYIARGLRFTMGVEELAGRLFFMETTGLLVASILLIFLVVKKTPWVE